MWNRSWPLLHRIKWKNSDWSCQSKTNFAHTTIQQRCCCGVYTKFCLMKSIAISSMSNMRVNKIIHIYIWLFIRAPVLWQGWYLSREDKITCQCQDDKQGLFFMKQEGIFSLDPASFNASRLDVKIVILPWKLTCDSAAWLQTYLSDFGVIQNLHI